jgi:hypothetical protein
MRELTIGVGQCGRRISESLVDSYINSIYPGHSMFKKFVENKRHDGFIFVDLPDFKIRQNILNYQSEIPLHKFRLEIGTGRGAGKDWTIGAEVANERFPDFYDQFLKGTIHSSEHINIIHSAAGGTGAGAGPVLIKNLIENNKELEGEGRKRVLITSTLVLPHEPEDRSRRNAAITLSRYYNVVDGIILVDNSQGNNLLNSPYISTRDTIRSNEETINAYTAQNLKWMNASDENLRTETFHASKTFESSDFRNLFIDYGNNHTGIIVPAYAEYDLDVLDDFQILPLILHTLSRMSLTYIDWKLPFESCIIFIGLPWSFTNARGKNARRASAIPSRDKLIESLYEVLNLKKQKNVDVVYVYSEGLRKIVVSSWVINPYIPQIVKLADLLYGTMNSAKHDEYELLAKTHSLLMQLAPQCIT